MLCFTTANDDKSHCIVYTDGSCINQGKDSAKAGFGVCWDENYHPNNYSGKVHGLQDSGHAELCAAEHAIKQAIDDGYRSITLRADSELVGHVVRNPEAFSKSSHPDYHDVISSISLMKSQIYIKVEYVKAHNGIPGNEKADELAKLGVRTASLETVWRYTRKMRKMMDKRWRERRGRGTVSMRVKKFRALETAELLSKEEKDVATTVPTVTKKFEKPTKSTRRLKIQKASTKPDAVGPTVTKPPTVSPSKPTVPFKPRPRPLKKLMKCRTMSLLSISSASRAKVVARGRNKKVAKLSTVDINQDFYSKNPLPMEAIEVTVDSQNSENSVRQQKQKVNAQITQKPEVPTNAKPKQTRRANKRKRSKTPTPGSRQSTVTKTFEKPAKSTRRLKIQKASTKPDAVGPTVTTPPTVPSAKPTVPFKPRPRPLKKLMRGRTMSLLSISSASRVARRFPRRRNNPVPMEATKVTVGSQNSKNSVRQQKQKVNAQITQKPEVPTNAKPKPTCRANKRQRSKAATPGNGQSTVTQKPTKPS